MNKHYSTSSLFNSKTVENLNSIVSSRPVTSKIKIFEKQKYQDYNAILMKNCYLKTSESNNSLKRIIPLSQLLDNSQSKEVNKKRNTIIRIQTNKTLSSIVTERLSVKKTESKSRKERLVELKNSKEKKNNKVLKFSFPLFFKTKKTSKVSFTRNPYENYKEKKQLVMNLSDPRLELKSQEFRRKNHDQLESIKKDVNFRFTSNFRLVKKNQMTSELDVLKSNSGIPNESPNFSSRFEDLGITAKINNEKTNQRKLKNLFRKFKNTVITAAIHLRQLMLTFEEFLSISIVPEYDLELTKRYLFAIKEGSTDLIFKMLNKNRMLALYYDQMSQNGLHWAIKRGHIEIMKILMGYGAKINKQDLGGNSPLHIACMMNSVIAVKILIHNKAVSDCLNKKGKKPVELTTNLEIINFIKMSDAVSIFKKKR